MFTAWTGPIPQASTRHNLLLDYLVHPLRRQLARHYLRFLKTAGCTVIGITGSFGKTTTKRLLQSILSQIASTAATDDNTDSVYNIPATILRTSPWTKFLIIEMSIEYLGEMDFYLWLAQPDIAIITSISLTHTEFLKNTETIAKEKSKIGKFAKDVIIGPNPDIQVITSGKIYKATLPRSGDQFSLNRALAIKTAEILSISKKDIARGLTNAKLPPHRMNIINHPSGATIIDDVHNANPTATKFAIDYLVNLAKKKNQTPVFIFAQMNQLGPYEKSAHSTIGKYVAQKGIKNFLTLGPATTTLGQHFDSKETLTPTARKFLTPNYCLLIKGSRSWHLETIISALTA